MYIYSILCSICIHASCYHVYNTNYYLFINIHVYSSTCSHMHQHYMYNTIGIMMFAVKKDKCMGCKTLISDKDKVYIYTVVYV